MEKEDIDEAVIVPSDGDTGQSMAVAPSMANLNEVPQTRTLIRDLARLIARFIFFKDRRIPLLIATWIVGTYVHLRFKYCGILWIHSPVLRCGKSSLLEIINALAWRSTGVMINVTPATLFRLMDEGCTFIGDEMERLRDSDKRRYGEVMATFNAGFAAGATIPRISKGTVRRFSVYGPKVLAGINAVTDTIRDRSFSIVMIRKAPGERTDKLNIRTQNNLFEPFRSVLQLWANKNGPLVQEFYDQMGKDAALRDCDDRFVDIAEPLVALVKYADKEADDETGQITDLLALLKALGEQRNETEPDEGIAALCSLFDKIFSAVPAGRSQLFVESAKLLEQVSQIAALKEIGSTKALSRYLEKLGLHPRRNKTGDKRGYTLSRVAVAEIKLRYLSDNRQMRQSVKS
jgi:hypothetical protein